MRRLITALVTAACVASLAAGCNGILGIEEAQLAPADAGGNDAGNDAFNPDVVSCDNYCAIIAANCTGKNTQYLNETVCKAICNIFDVGQITDQHKDTTGCRQAHARQAANAPLLECPKAGALSAAACGTTPCHQFCLLDDALCSPPTGPGKQYTDIPTCEADCANYPFRPDAPVPDITAGDSLNCRVYHLEAAANNALGVHCPHTAKSSAFCTGDAGL